MSVNKVIIVGHLGGDPEVSQTPSGTSVCNFSVATSEAWKNKDGEDQKRTDWHRVIAWAKLGENCGKYLAKGREVYVEGKLQTRSWEDKDTGKKVYRTEIIARDVQFLGSKSGGDSSSGSGSSGGGYDGQGFGGGGGTPDDDIPF